MRAGGNTPSPGILLGRPFRVTRTEVSFRRSMAAALWILATIATLFFLRSASQLLIPIVLAVLISYALEPIVAWLARHHVARTFGTSLVLLVLVGLLGLGGYAMRGQVQQSVLAVPALVREAQDLVRSAVQGARTDAGRSGGDTGQEIGTGGAAVPSLGDAASYAGLIQTAASSVFSLAGQVLVVFFLVFFLLLSGHHVRDRLIEIAGPEQRRTAERILDDINAQVQRFLLVRLATSAIVGAATWLVLAWMDVENAVVWGALAGVFNSIPYFGPVIVSGGLFGVGIVQGGGVTKALEMSGAALIITSLEGWLLTPPLLGKAERMSALAVFLGLLVWTWLWGAWGTILAVPMLVVVKSVADRVEVLKPIGRMMAP
jgi:predicted PurR-regulated permease PerM